MTQRIQSPTPSPELRHASGGPSRITTLPGANVDLTPRGALDPVWRWGYVAICLLAIAAAGVIVRGGVAKAELRLATVAVDTALVFRDICFANGDRRISPAEQACANPQENRTLASGVC